MLLTTKRLNLFDDLAPYKFGDMIIWEYTFLKVERLKYLIRNVISHGTSKSLKLILYLVDLGIIAGLAS